MPQRRVVITGYGIVSPMGLSAESTWKALIRGESGVAPITHFDATTFPTRIAGEVKGLDFPAVWRSLQMDYSPAASISQNTKLALLAGHEAWIRSGLRDSRVPRDRIGIYLGAGKGEAVSDLLFLSGIVPSCFNEKGELQVSRLVPMILERMEEGKDLESEPSRAAHHMVRALGIEGPVSTCLTACAAGAQAIGEGFEMIRCHEADVVLAGGCHSMVTPQGIMGFNLLGALSTDNHNPAGASRPFDKTRNGFVLSEGGAIVVLEELELAKKRGVPILAELVGYGCTADAYRVTDPHPDAIGEIEAIRLALKGGGVSPDEVDYINAHGTSTRDNDQTETRAIKDVFGPRAYKIPVSSTKSMTGHLIAAAGALELIVCCLSIRDGIVPPTINYGEVDEECDLDYVPHHAREVKVQTALTNSFGFGGQNTSLVVRKISL